MPGFRTSDGLNIVTYEWGAERAGPPVILHHGFAANAQVNWEGAGVVQALIDAGRHVISIDARGHGASDKPHDVRFYGEGRMALDVSELIDAIGVESVDLCGYSMGGIVSLFVGTRDKRVRRLICGGIGDGVVARGGLDTRVVTGNAIADALLAESVADVKDPAAANFRRFADSTGADRLALAAVVQAVHSGGMPLSDIAAPTLVLVGDQDVLATRPANLAAAIPNAQLTVVKGDHLSCIRDPAFAKAIVDFFR